MADQPSLPARPGTGVRRPRSAVVVGGGIAGLAAAIALASTGWEVTVLEQAAVFWEAGAGLTITANGERGLAALGVADAVREAGHRISLTGVRAADGRWLVRLPQSAMTGIGVHRRSLHAALVDAASAAVDLRPGARVLGVDVGAVSGRQARVRWRQGSTEQVLSADLLVGADGANSTVRHCVASRADVRRSGHLAWRAVVADTQLIGSDQTIWWGPGAEFSAQRIGPDRLSWHCLLPNDGRTSSADPLTGISGLVATWPDEVRSVVAATTPEAIFRHDITVATGEVRSFSSGRAVLVGDAAHPILPTISQGANLGIEDGVTLGRLLGRDAELDRALRRYDALRLPRSTRLAQRARLLARLGCGCSAGPERIARDTVLSRLPAGIAMRFLERITDWRPPEQ